jgi:hypothetical protein
MDINMKNFAIINNGIVENIIVWDTSNAYDPIGQAVEISEGAFVSIGFLYQDGEFVDPNPPVIEEIPQEV